MAFRKTAEFSLNLADFRVLSNETLVSLDFVEKDEQHSFGNSPGTGITGFFGQKPLFVRKWGQIWDRSAWCAGFPKDLSK